MASEGGVPSLLTKPNVLHVACLGACQVLEAPGLAASKPANALRLLTSWDPEAMGSYARLERQCKLPWRLQGGRKAFTLTLAKDTIIL